MARDAARGGGRSRRGMVPSMQSSPADSELGSSVRGMSVDTNVSVSPAQEAGAKSGRGKQGTLQESSAAVLSGSATQSKQGGHSLLAGEPSPGSGDNFQHVSKGRTRPKEQRQLLDSIDEGATGSSKNAPKRRAAEGPRPPAKKGPVPRKPAPGAMSAVSVTDEMTQDVHGKAESSQMEFQVGDRAHTHARTFCLLHTRISCLACCVCGIFVWLM